MADDDTCQHLASVQHPERVQVGLEDRFLLLALVGVLLAHPHHGAQHLDVEAGSLGLRIDVADIVGERLLFLFQLLDARNDRLELILGEAVGGFLLDGGRGGHRSILH